MVKPKSEMSGKGFGCPLSLLYLSASLKNNGFNDVYVKDLTFSRDAEGEISELLKEKKPAIAGVTVNCHDRFQAIDIIKLAKKASPETVTVLGGPHAILCGEEIMKELSELDILVIGDGEAAIVEIAQAVKNKSGFGDIKGIYYHGKTGSVKATPSRPMEMNLDVYPFPDWDAINVRDYNLYLPVEGKPKAISLISSRGCPFKCNFCAAKEAGGGIIRFRSVRNIVDEIKKILEKFPGYSIFIYDDHFLMNKKRVLEFCEMVKEEGLDFQWGCYGRVDAVDEEMAEEIAKVGCKMISFGVESGSEYVLKLMNKKTDPGKIRKAISAVKKFGIVARCSIIFNYPGERIIDMFKTFWLLWRADIDPDEIALGENTLLYPATEVFYQLKDKCLPKDFSWSRKYPNLPHYKNVPIYIPPFYFFRISLVRVLRRFYTLFYRIKKIRNFSDLKTLAKACFRVVFGK